MESFFTKKCLSLQIERGHQSSESDSNVLEKTTISAHNNKTLIVGPSNDGRNYYILKKIEKISTKGPIQLITTYLSQYPTYKKDAEIESTDKHREPVVTFDDMLGARNSSQVDQFFTRGRHEALDNHYTSQIFLFYETKHQKQE